MRSAYLFQSFIILIWWVIILFSKDFYGFFEFNQISKDVFICFLIPDFLLIAFLSLFLSYKNIPSIKYAILGAFSYAAVFCVSATITLGGGEISSILMVFGVLFNILLCYKQSAFRSALPSSSTNNLIKTLFQICMVWGIFLFIVPSLLLRVERIEITFFQLELKSLIASLLFIVFSGIGIWSGYCLSKYGKGTPLPADATNQLVITGPYAYVRNPMAICGIGQCLCIGLYACSYSILIYSLLAFFAWNFVVRKLEEDDMEAKFGEEFIKYKASVKCWIPSLKKHPKQ